jgi:hypothetical protein
MNMPDCGSNSCKYAVTRGGMRTNSGCGCDNCETCGVPIRSGRKHRAWCPTPEWVPAHHGGEHRRGEGA